MHKTTLEQWVLLGKVAELGSFAKAVGEANRSQSSAGYNLALLQERLGVTLLTSEGRKAVLTPAGELLLNQVGPLLKAFLWVKARTATLQNGTRTWPGLMIDSILPRKRLFAILKQLQQAQPQTQMRLTEVLENGDAWLTAHANTGVMVLARRQDVTRRGKWLMNIDFVAVAHRNHPFCMLDASLNEDALRAWPLIHIANRDNPQQSAHDTRILSTIDAAIDAVMYQVGYGWSSEKHIQTQLNRGPLRPLPLSHGIHRAMPLHLVVKDTLTPLGEQVNTLLRLL